MPYFDYNFAPMRLRLIFVLFTTFVLSACSVYNKAEKKFQQGEYDVAIDYYKKVIKADGEEKAKALYYTAEAYRLSNRLEMATPFYKAAIDADESNQNAYYFYARGLKANSNYEEARSILEQNIANIEDGELKDLMRAELNNLDNINRILEDSSLYTVSNLKAVNTKAAEYAPFYYNGHLYFTSTRSNDRVYKATGDGFSDIYKVKTQGAKIDTTTTQMLPSVINWPNANEGSVAITSDGRTMVFAKGNTGKRKGANDVNLYITRYRNKKWSEPQLMDINDPTAWNSTPSFSSDNRTLYFASTRGGGFGGTDIYSATVNSRGRWGNVRNLGDKVNTAEDEMFPSTSEDGKLYFSSNGHPGFGKLDLFTAERKGGRTVISHLGAPMNSNKDDFALFLYAPDRGFFSSDRDGGIGRDDIYTFKNEDPNLKIVNYYLAGTTTTRNNNNQEVILPGTQVKFYSSDSVLIGEVVTGQEGKFSYRVSEEEDYFIIADKADYFTTRKLFSTKGKSLDRSKLTELVTNKTFEVSILLEEIVLDKAFELENIYYDFDSANIRADAAVELDKLVTILNDNPPIKIELSSHTDSRGEPSYNLDLSKRRAESAVAYIISQGISANRIKAKGYGESRLIIKDAQTEEDHEVNRRTEFKVTEYDKEIARQIREAEDALFKRKTVEVEVIDEREAPVKKEKEDEFDFN